MKSIRIYLNTFDKIKNFIDVAERLNCELNLKSGNYIANGKSILGIFNLDLSNEIEVTISNHEPQDSARLKELEHFIS